jgi:hypothetical protein
MRDSDRLDLASDTLTFEDLFGLSRKEGSVLTLLIRERERDK